MKLPIPASHLPRHHHQHQQSSFSDFILLAEFCEQRGPVTLLTIPFNRSAHLHSENSPTTPTTTTTTPTSATQHYDHSHNTVTSSSSSSSSSSNSSHHFDFDSFVRRILSSDHTRKVDPGGCHSGWINPDDTMVYLSDGVQRAHAYVHHLTLHDVEARGYVRPLCLCYVTQEELKIMQNFEQLMHTFTQLSNLMKYGNNCIFLTDIEAHLIDASLQNSGFPDVPSEQFDFVVKELEVFKNRFLVNIQLQQQEQQQTENTDVVQVRHDDGSGLLVNDIAVSRNSNNNDENNHNTSSDNNVIVRENVNENDAVFLEREELSTTNVINAADDNGAVRVRNLCDPDFAIDEELVEQVFVNTFSNDPLPLPRDFVHLFERGLGESTPLLSQYIPIVLKHIHKKSGFDKKLRTFPEIVEPLYEAIVNLSQHCLAHFSRPFHLINRELDDLNYRSDRIREDNLYIGGMFILDISLQNEVDSPTKSVSLSSGQSKHSSLARSSPSNVRRSAESQLSGFSSGSHFRASPPVYSMDWNSEELGTPASDNDWGFTNSPMYFTPRSSLPHKSSSQSFESDQSSSSIMSNLTQQSSLLLNYRGQGSYLSNVFPTSNQGAIHTLNPKVNRNSTGLAVMRTSGRSLLTEMIRAPTSGTFALQLIQAYSFAKDVIYSVLTGVPVLICGIDQNELLVRNFVSTLRLFIPGLQPHDTSSVIPWRTTPITTLELTSKIKLAGISKKVTLSKSVEAFACRLDIEEHKFVGPCYRGELLDRICSLDKRWPDEQTFVSYVHSQFLEWGNKAALFYHLDSIGAIRSYFFPHIPRVVNVSKYEHNSSTLGSLAHHWTHLLRPNSRHRRRRRRRRDAHQSHHPSNLKIPTLAQQREYVAMQTSSLAMYDLERITDHSKTILNGLGIVKRCDIAIIEYLVEVMKQQQRETLDASMGITSSHRIQLPTQEKIEMHNTRHFTP